MKIEVVAELAQGFEGCVQQSKLMVKAAATAGANAVKFQLVYADELATLDYVHYDLFKTLEMSDTAWFEIKCLCDELGIELILDVFGETSLSLAEKLDISTIKLHATDISNTGFFFFFSSSSRGRVMLGAGGAYSNEIKHAINVLERKKIILFHGFQGYPTAIEENQISRLKTWNKMFCVEPNVKLGFSDHIDPNSFSSISIPAFAVGQGALTLEKHLTLGVCMELEDFETAMNPDQFKVFVGCMRDLECSYGDTLESDDFGMLQSESQYRLNIRRDVVTAMDTEAGTVLGEMDVFLKRSSAQSAFKNIADVTGKTVKFKIEANKPVSSKAIE